MRNGFLIMPFRADLDWLRDEIVAAGIDEDVDITRADDIFKPGVVLDQVLKAIDEAAVIVAVCTGKNANVFFELGYAWRRRDAILVAEGTNDLPFDVQHFRTELYGGEASGQHRRTLRGRLRRAMQASLEEPQLPEGQRLTVPPKPKHAARITGRFMRSGRSHRLTLTNTGTVDIYNVGVVVPEEATSFHLVRDDLPVSVLRPGESIELHVAVVMGDGPNIFDLAVTGTTGEDAPISFPVKISM